MKKRPRERIWRFKETNKKNVARPHTCTHRALEDHAVAVAHAFDVRGQVEADGSVADGIHGLCVEEVVGPRWRGEWRGDVDEDRVKVQNKQRGL